MALFIKKKGWEQVKVGLTYGKVLTGSNPFELIDLKLLPAGSGQEFNDRYRHLCRQVKRYLFPLSFFRRQQNHETNFVL